MPTLTEYMQTSNRDEPARTRAPAGRTPQRKEDLFGDPNIEAVQQFLLDLGYNIGSRTGKPDGSWGPASNRALISALRDYHSDPQKIPENVRPILAQWYEKANQYIDSRNPAETEKALNWFAKVIAAGGQIKGTDATKARKPIRDIPINFRGVSMNFPAFDALRDKSLHILNSVMLNEVLWAYWKKIGQTPPQTMKDVDPALMQEALNKVMQDLINYIDTNVDPQRKDMQWQQVKSVIRQRFHKLMGRYQTLQNTDQTEKKTVRNEIVKDLASTFYRAKNYPELYERMLTRAERIMEVKGAADAQGNIVNNSLYRASLGRVNREMLNWLKHFKGMEALEQPTGPQNTKPTKAFQSAMKNLEQIPKQHPNVREIAENIQPPQ